MAAATTRRWTFPNTAADRVSRVARESGLPEVMAKLLVNRGVESPSAVAEFLNPSLDNLVDPWLLKDLDRAVDRLKLAIERHEKIVVYGDFDVDGTVSTSLMMLMFRLVGADAEYYIPKRLEEGYGLNVAAIARLKKRGCSVLVTVDNGITAVAEVQSARSLGVDVIITDHHVPGEHLPSAFAVVNPKQPGCRYPHHNLAGVGVAFKVVWGLCESLGIAARRPEEFAKFLETAMGLVCIATVADVVPLIGENRVFTSYGLRTLPRSPNLGVRALLETCNLSQQPLDASHIGFRLAPRLNAGGRMGHEDLGIRLLMADTYQEALYIAHMMEEENRQRQEIERAMTADARRRVAEEIDLKATAVIVLASDTWHPGVIGIVASRIAEEFWRPTVMLSLRGATGRGSARSIPTFSIYNALATCEDLLISFGGHDFAAGMEINREDVDEFRLRLNAVAGDFIRPTTLQPCMNIDAEIQPHLLTPEMVRQIEEMAPHGEANPTPVFATGRVGLVGRPRLVGKLEQHISFYVREPNTDNVPAVHAIAYNRAADFEKLLQGPLRLAFTPRLNRYPRNGEIGDVELVIKDFHPADDAESVNFAPPPNETKVVNADGNGHGTSGRAGVSGRVDALPKAADA